jgi:hypothetical protein
MSILPFPRRFRGALLFVVLGLVPSLAVADDLTLDQGGDWYAQFIFSKAKFGNSFVIENPVCTYAPPAVFACPGAGGEQCPAGATTPTALFNTADPADCPDVCPGGEAGGTETTCTPGGTVGDGLFQLFLGTFPAGTVVQSRKDVDQDKDGTPEMSWHSNPATDNDGFDHVRTRNLAPGVFRLEWEDLPKATSDFDFNDGVYMLIRYPEGTHVGLGDSIGYRIGNVVAGTPLHFVPRVEVDPVGANPRRLTLTISVFNEDTQPIPLATCAMLNLALQGSPPANPCGPFERLNVFCYPTSGAAIPTLCGTSCGDPNARFSLTDGTFVTTPQNDDVLVVPGASGSQLGEQVWRFSAPLGSFVPSLESFTPEQIIQKIFSSAEQLYVDFLVDPNTRVVESGLTSPFRCPSGFNVETHLSSGTSIQGFKFAWTAPVQNIASPVTFQTAFHNAITMTNPDNVTARTEVVWQELDPEHPVGASIITDPPRRTDFVLNNTVPGEGTLTIDFPTTPAEGFIGIATQYVSRASSGEILVTQTMKAVSDHQAPEVESANVKRDATNRLNVKLSATDQPASIQSVQLTPSVDATAGLPSFMRWRTGNYQTETTFDGQVGPVSAGGTVALNAAAGDEVGNSRTLQLAVAHAGLDRDVECTSTAGASVMLDGGRTTGVTPLQFAWTGPFGTASGQSPAVPLAIGYSCVNLAVTDAQAFTAADASLIHVVDTTPPVIDTATLTPTCIPPSKHKYVRFVLGEDVQVTAHDTCDSNPVVRIVDIDSNQPDDDLADGGTTGDILPGAEGFCLRAERSGAMGDRIYTVTVAAIDAAGNQSTRQLFVTVPRSGGNCPALAPTEFLDEGDPLCVFPNPPVVPPTPQPPPACDVP